MGWRFVKQPNGLLSVYDDGLHNFTHINMSVEIALEVASKEYGLRGPQLADKVKAGVEDYKPRTRSTKGSGHDRWVEAALDVKCVHSKEVLEALLVEIASAKDQHVDRRKKTAPQVQAPAPKP